MRKHLVLQYRELRNASDGNCSSWVRIDLAWDSEKAITYFRIKSSPKFLGVRLFSWLYENTCARISISHLLKLHNKRGWQRQEVGYDLKKPKQLSIYATARFPVWQLKYMDLLRVFWSPETKAVNVKELNGKISKMEEMRKLRHWCKTWRDWRIARVQSRYLTEKCSVWRS